MKIRGRFFLSTLLAVSLIITFSISTFGQEVSKKYTNKDGTYRIERTDGSRLLWKQYFDKNGTKTRFENYGIDGKLFSTTYYNSDGTTSRVEYSDGTTITYTYNSDGTPSKTVYSDGTVITYNKDGSHTVQRPDGSKIVADKDGNLTEYDKNGNLTGSFKYIGDVDYYKEEKDGSITYYTYNDRDISFKKEYTEHADGRVTTYDENGNVEAVFYPVIMVRVEGSMNGDDALYYGYEEYTNTGERLPKGKVKWELYYTINEDGSKSYWEYPHTEDFPLFVVYPDGTVTYYYGNDEIEGMQHVLGHHKKYTQHQDGSRTYYFYDKKYITKHSDGSVTYYTFPTDKKNYTKHSDGSVTYYDENEKKYRTDHPDGSSTYYNEDEKVASFEDPDGNRVFYDEDGNITKVRHSDGSETHYTVGKKDYEERYGEKSYYHEVLSRSVMYTMTFWDGPAYPDMYERIGKEDDTDGLFNKGLDTPIDTYTDKDGNVVTEYPDGRKEYTDKKGNRVTESPDGSKRVCKKDGSCTHYDKNGDIYAETDKNGKTTYYDKDGKTAASETPEGDVVFYESFFGDSVWKAIMEEYRVETDKNGSYIVVRTDWETGNVDAPPPNEGDTGETGSFDVGTPTPELGGDAETGSFDVGTPTPETGGDAETGSFDVGTPTPEPGGDAETGSFDVGTPTPEPGGDAETGSFDVGTPTPEPGGDAETGSFDVGTPTPEPGGDTEGTDSAGIGTSTPGAPDGYIEDENGNRTYFDASGNKVYTISEDENLILTYNPDGTADRIEDKEQGTTTTFFYENDALHHTFNSGTGATTYYDEEGAGIYMENADGSVTDLDGVGGVGSVGGLSKEAVLLFGITEKQMEPMEPGTIMEMEDDPFSKGLSHGITPPSDNGVPYEMIDTGVGGSGDMEMIDPGLQMDSGSMTLE